MVDGVVHAVLAGEDELGDGDHGVALLKQIVQNAGQGFRGVLGGVVEQDDGAALDLPRHPLGDVGGGQVLPVQAVHTGYSFKRPRLAELPEYPRWKRGFLPVAPCRLIRRGKYLY